MPTVIALDLSLSMCQPIPGTYSPGTSTSDISTKHTLAIQVINQFLDHVSAHSRLEFVSLLAFSRLYQKITDFSRDLDIIKAELPTLKHYEKTNYGAILSGISEVVQQQWGSTTPVQIVVITDGSAGFGEGCLKDTIKKAKPFPFPAKMNIVCLSDSNDKNYTENCQMLQKLIEVTCGDGVVYFPENHLSAKGCSSAVAKLCAKDFTPYKGKLTFGKLYSKITLCPPPQPFVCREDEKRYDISEAIDIIGLIGSNDLASPPAHSRHLIFPLRCEDNASPATSSKGEETDEDSDGRVANFCVLLHGALKIEGMCAFCEIGPEWYGFIYSWADNKKKSNLMLSILPPGTDVAPWLGNLEQLGPKDEYSLFSKGRIPGISSHHQPQEEPAFPVRSPEKKSYSTNPTVWLTPQSVNSDINKLLRHARKLPEKTSQFYKELNRMRRWALTLGFYEILESIAMVIEKECMAASASNPESAIQLTHAASQIRLKNLPYNRNISPLKH